MGACTANGCAGHSVTSAHVDMQIDNNGTWEDAFQFGQPGDFSWTLAGQTFAMDVRLSRYDAIALLQMSTGNGRILTDDVVQRVIHFNVDPTTIKGSLTPGTYVYDLVMLDGSNPSLRVPLMHGQVTVCQGVTVGT